MWWRPEKADTGRKCRVLVLGCLRWGLHGPGCVPLALSSGQDSIWYGLQSWALCTFFEGCILMYDIVFYSGKVMGELRIQLYRLSRMSDHNYWLWTLSLFIQQWSLGGAAINTQLQIFLQFFLCQKMKQSALVHVLFHLHGNWIFKVCELSALVVFVVSLLCEYFPFDCILDSLANQE